MYVKRKIHRDIRTGAREQNRRQVRAGPQRKPIKYSENVVSKFPEVIKL